MLGQALPAAAPDPTFPPLCSGRPPVPRSPGTAARAGSRARRVGRCCGQTTPGAWSSAGSSGAPTGATRQPTNRSRDVIAEAAYEFRTNRYHLDGSVVYHLGRRQTVPDVLPRWRRNRAPRRDEGGFRLCRSRAPPETDPGGPSRASGGQSMPRCPSGGRPTPPAPILPRESRFMCSTTCRRAPNTASGGRGVSRIETQQVVIGVNYYR